MGITYTNPRNAVRRKRAATVDNVYRSMSGQEEPEEAEAALIDLFADLCHLAYFRGLEPKELFRIGHGHFDAERDSVEE